MTDSDQDAELITVFDADDIRELADLIADAIPPKTSTALALLSLASTYVKHALTSGWSEQRILGVVAMAVEAYKPPPN